jgi:hypothetical protein
MVNQVADHDSLTPGSGVPVPAMRLSVVLEGRSESRYDEGWVPKSQQCERKQF